MATVMTAVEVMVVTMETKFVSDAEKGIKVLTDTEHLHLISNDTRLVIPPTKGVETLIDQNVFYEIEDSLFSPPYQTSPDGSKSEVEVQVFELVKDGRFAKIFSSFDVSLNNLCLTQEQIKTFCRYYPEWLRKSGFTTSFLFHLAGSVWVASVVVRCDGNLVVRRRPLSFGVVCQAEFKARYVVPRVVPRFW